MNTFFNTFFARVALAACTLPLAAQASNIVNVDALCSKGTSITLNPGTYSVSVVGTSQGGLYDGWNDSTANLGSSKAAAALGRWKDSFDLTANGVTKSYVAAGDPLATSALGALANYQSSILGSTSQTANTILLTLASTQSINFTVSDCRFTDNWGGESFKITPVAAASATPEPSTFGLFGLALAGAAGLARKKFAK